MKRRFGVLLVAPLVTIVAAACGGGGGDGQGLFASPTKPGEPTEVVVLGGNTPTPRAGADRTPTPDADISSTPGSVDPDATATPYPAGPEGAVNADTIGRQPTGSSEVGDSGIQPGGPPPIGPWVTPLAAWDSVELTFGEDRGEPLTHGGIDFRVDSTPGVEVYAVCDGFVAGIEYSETHGQYIVLKCPDKWTAVYGYMESVEVEVDDDVVKGETVLGTVGSFLHFELRWNFRPIDPDSQLQYHVRPGGVLLVPTPTPTSTPDPRDIEPTETPTPVPTATTPPTTGGGSGGSGGTTPPPSTPTPAPTSTPAGPPTATPTQTDTPTPEPTATPTPKPPTPTPTPLPQAF